MAIRDCIEYIARIIIHCTWEIIETHLVLAPHFDAFAKHVYRIHVIFCKRTMIRLARQYVQYIKKRCRSVVLHYERVAAKS